MKNKIKSISKREALKLYDFSDYPFMNLSLVDLQGEKWLAIPQFDDCYFVSNYGRVKAMPRLIERTIQGIYRFYYSKERIVPQSLAGRFNEHIQKYNFQLLLNLTYEGQMYRFSVHRIVYELFIGKIDFASDKLSIVHKDADNLNNSVENLEASDSTTLFYKSVKINRRPPKPNHTKKTHNQVGVLKYDLQGNLLHHFPSVIAAAKSMETKVFDLKKVLINQERQCKGFVFRYETDTYNGEYADFSKTKKISQYTAEGILVKIYDSIIQAYHETGINASTISKCALHKKNFASGFVWRYDGEEYKGEYVKRIVNIAVHQYHVNGEFIQEFTNISLASKSINIHTASISSCLRGKSKTAGGYVWRYKEQTYLGEYKNHTGSTRGKPITQLDQDGNIVATFNSISAASKATSVSFQNHVLSNNPITLKNFEWRIATEQETAQMLTTFSKKQHSKSIGVIQYTKEGEKIASFGSILEASDTTGVPRKVICNFIENPHHVGGKFVWRREGDIYQGELKDTTRKNEAKTVTQYDLDGNKINVYSSSYAAIKSVKTSQSSIGLALNGEIKSACGFIWQYGDGPDKLDIKSYYAKFEYINPRSKSVSCYDLEGNKVGFYKSLGEAAREHDVPYISVSNVINGKAKSAYNLIWILGEGFKKIDIEKYLSNSEVRAISES